VLGDTGLNFGAGMTGGFAMVYDEHDQFQNRYNNELVDINRINTESTEQYRHFVREQLEQHVKLTGSVRARDLLDQFSDVIGKFWLVKSKALHLDSLLKD
jgi:glutamate synthase (NADPH/NADH) large chain